MSSLTYDDVTLNYVTIENKQRTEYDSSGLQYRHTHFTTSCVAHLNPNLYPALQGETDASQIEKRIRSILLRPRQYLEIDIGNDQNIIVNPPDAIYGPKPIDCDVLQIMGNQTIVIRFVVEYALYECPSNEAGTAGNDQGVPAWTTHTWSDRISIDEFWLTTRTRTGTITVRGDAQMNPDSFRNIVVPQIPNGFVRIQPGEYVVQEDGLAMSYKFVDKEVLVEPPDQSIKIEGERWAQSDPNGVKWTQSVRVKLWGAKGTSKGSLITSAVYVVYNMLKFGNNDKSAKILQARIADGLEENWIEVSVTQSYLNDGVTGSFYGINTQGYFNVDLDTLPIQNPNPQQNPPDPGTGGSSLLQAITPVLNDPCLNTLYAQQNTATLTAAGNYGQSASITTVQVLPNQQSSVLSTEMQGGIYTEYQLRTSYIHDANTLQGTKVGSNLATYCQLSEPSCTKVVRWVGSRYDQPPSMPNPQLFNDDNSVYLGGSIDADAAQVTADGKSPLYSASGVYYYAMTNPDIVTINAGRLPYTTGSYSNTIYSTFTAGLTDNGQQTSTLVTGGFTASPGPVYPFNFSSTLTTNPGQ